MKARDPFTAIADRLTSGPPSLAFLLDLFENVEYIGMFIALVRTYIPEHEALINRMTINDKIGYFFRFFSEKYFPLDDEGVQSAWENGKNLLATLVGYIPASPEGFMEEQYHEFLDTFNQGQIMLLSLVTSPFEEEHEEWCHSGMTMRTVGSSRIPIIEQVKQWAGKELADLIPAAGWTPPQLHALVDGTKYGALGDFADRLHNQTGTWWQDVTREEFDSWDWSRENVDLLLKDWKKAREIEERIEKLATWLEKNPRRNFAELLRFLLGAEKVPKTLMEIFEPEEVKNDNDRELAGIQVGGAQEAERPGRSIETQA